MKYIFLTENFYTDYSECPEIAQKDVRPYILVYIRIHDVDFAIPMRSNIRHNYAFWTDKEERCGVDYSKAVIVENELYIDKTTRPYIRPHEHKALIGREHEIREGMIRYINKYIDAKKNPNNHAKRRLVEYSTLQYFEKYIGLTGEASLRNGY